MAVVRRVLCCTSSVCPCRCDETGLSVSGCRRCSEVCCAWRSLSSGAPARGPLQLRRVEEGGGFFTL